ncbi:MAG: 1-(5-phosphoribosyl)-5-[(5-phosphoribosylamino)methylideneamino] imidazole-4-carboxamide isomerase [Bacteroidota bacterium]
MRLIPAIDLLGGQCVRLQQGDYTASTEYSSDPVAVAQTLWKEGFRDVHLVDLDGARKGTIQQLDLVEKVCAATELSVDFGGGVKSRADLDGALAAGCQQVGIGSLAVWEPEKVLTWLREVGPERIILTADVRDLQVAVSGWEETSALNLFDHLDRFVAAGLRHCICTDIARDGMLQGPSLELYQSLLDRYQDLQLIASGGIRSEGDLQDLQQIGCAGAIFGKAYYEGLLTATDLQAKGWIKSNEYAN